MVQRNFRDPRAFVPPLLDYIDLSRLPSALDESVVDAFPGLIKSAPDCSDFIVLEPVGEYPGMPEYMRRGPIRFLSAGPESDMPGLQTDKEMYVNYYGRRVPAIAITVYKWCIGTWAVQDAIARGISKQLRITLHPNDVLTSGLKDRRGRTVQHMVIPGVSMADARKIDWSRIQWSGPRSGFLVKDIRPTDKTLRLGSHRANFFDVRIRVPGKTRAELEAYMAPRVAWLSRRDFLIPNYFHRQRLGPWQNMHEHWLALLTGNYTPQVACNKLMTHAEVLLHHLVFQPSARDSQEVRQLRAELASHWQFDFGRMHRILRRDNQYRKLNMNLEYEIVSRLAQLEVFGGCAEAIIYDLKKRISLCVGAWQGFYWNWELYNQLHRRQRPLLPNRNANIPLAMACDDARAFYGRSELGRQCLEEMAVLERQAAWVDPEEPGGVSGDEYLETLIENHWRAYWQDVDAKRAQNPDYRPDRATLPDEFWLSFELVYDIFGSRITCDKARPEPDVLSAALMKRLFLVPRDEEGRVRTCAPRRRAFFRAEDFRYDCDDEVVRIQTWLRSGAYFTTLAGTLFDTNTDPDEAGDADGTEEVA